MKTPASLLPACLALLLLGACSAPAPHRSPGPPESVGVADVELAFSFSADRVEEREIRVGQERIPMDGPLFTLELGQLGRLGPEDFFVSTTDGFGTTQSSILLTAARHPLEVEVIHTVRLGDPSFEKSLRVRWTGQYGQSPRLDRVVIQDMPITGNTRGGGRGTPLLGPGLFLLHASPWGTTARVGGRALVSEEPGVTLGGGWWSSGIAVLGPSGPAPAESALLRWLSHRRGGTPLVLLHSGWEGGDGAFAPPAGVELVALASGDQAKGDRPPSPAQPPGLTVPPGSPLLLELPAGLRAEERRFTTLVAAPRMRAERVSLLLLDGLSPAGRARPLLDFIERHRALPSSRRLLGRPPVAVRWAGEGGTPAPLWQFWLDYQEPPAAFGDCLLNRSTMRLAPWRKRGEVWSPRLAADLVSAIARGTGLVNLGVLPPPGPGRRHLLQVLAWAGARRELLQVMRPPLPGELDLESTKGIWLGRRPGRMLLVIEGRSDPTMAQLLPRGWKPGRVVQVHPVRAELAKGSLPPVAGDLRVILAWQGEEPAAPLCPGE